MSDGELDHVQAGISGHVHVYDVFLAGDVVRIVEDAQPDPVDVKREVENLGEFVEDAEALRLGWAEFPDGDEVVYLYDRADDNFGYAVNLGWAPGSEWGYAPFEREPSGPSQAVADLDEDQGDDDAPGERGDRDDQGDEPTETGPE